MVVNNKKSLILLSICLVIILSSVCISCNYKNDISKNVNKNEIIYRLPEKTNLYIRDTLLDNNKAWVCTMSFDINTATTSISFSIGEKKISERWNYLLNNTNRFLLINDEKIPILFDEDDYFVDFPKVENVYLENHSLKCIILKIDTQGNIIESIKMD